MSKITKDKKTFTNEVTGTISHATHRPQDLIPRFMNVIDLFVKEGGELNNWDELVKEIREKLMVDKEFVDDDHEEWMSEFTCFVLNEDLINILCYIEPKGYYFGCTEGDGSDFGYWAFCEKEEGFSDDDVCLDCPHKDTDNCPENQ